MVMTAWKWIKRVINVTAKPILIVVGLTGSGVLGYFVIKLLLKQLWNISDDLGDNISDILDE